MLCWAKAGIEQAYNVGKFLKKRYKQFLKHKQNQAFLRSSAAQRCIDTISIVAKKLWPPEVDEEKSWQPVGRINCIVEIF